MTFDANNEIVILAFAVVDVEKKTIGFGSRTNYRLISQALTA